MIFPPKYPFLLLFWGRKEAIHRNGTELLPQRPIDLGEHTVEIAFFPVAYTGTLEFVGQTVVDRNRAINTFNDLAECDFGRRTVELIPSCHAFVRLGDTGLGQLAQDFERKTESHARCFRNILCTLLATRKCQTVGHTNCIIRFMCDSQVVPSFLLSEQHQYNIVPSKCQ